MRIISRFLAIVLALITGVMATGGYFSVRREIGLFDAEMEHDVGLLADSLEAPLRTVWETVGAEAALRLVESANRESHRVKIRWLWLDSPAATAPLAPLSKRDRKRLLRGRDTVKRVADPSGTEHLISYVPLILPGKPPVALEIEANAQSRDRYVRATILRTLILTLAMILLCSLLAIWIGISWLARPLDTLVRKANRVASGDLRGPIRLRVRNELNLLAEALNVMCERLAQAHEAVREQAEARVAAVEQLRHMDRLKTVGTLSAGIAHELGTPLNVVSGRAALIGSGELCPPDTIESAKIIRKQAERMTRIIRQLLDFSRERHGVRRAIDIRSPVAETVELLSPLAKKNGTEIAVVQPSNPVCVHADPEQLSQVFSNLVVNSIQAMPHGGCARVLVDTIELTAPASLESRDGLYARIVIEDEGTGISEPDSARVFDPFYTTKDVGQGSGLGLSIAYGIVRDHGGWIELSSRPKRGSRFTTYIPAMEDRCAASS